MKSRTAWLLLMCGTIGCGEKPETVVEKPKALPEEPKAVVSEPDVVEKPKPGIEDLKALISEAQKECGEKLGLEPAITNSIGMKLALIPPGEFLMGSPDSDDAWDREKPQHRVRITQSFYLGMYEVTQAEYERVMGKNPSHFKSGPDAPVEGVSWDDAQEFCQKLSELAEEKEAGRRYRLPTEAEWEYACRAGTTTRYSFGDDPASLGEYAWYADNSDRKTHPVGEKKRNAWGLHDMHGNVCEWCADWYGKDYYAGSPPDDPPGPDGASERVIRGAHWRDSAGVCRAAVRGRFVPRHRDGYLGFRVAAVPPSKSSREQASKKAEPGA